MRVERSSVMAVQRKEVAVFMKLSDGSLIDLVVERVSYTSDIPLPMFPLQPITTRLKVSASRFPSSSRLSRQATSRQNTVKHVQFVPAVFTITHVLCSIGAQSFSRVVMVLPVHLCFQIVYVRCSRRGSVVQDCCDCVHYALCSYPSFESPGGSLHVRDPITKDYRNIYYICSRIKLTYILAISTIAKNPNGFIE